MKRDALERWVDDEFFIGHHLGTLMHAHLDLEESIAMGSLSQDELSHCSLICEMLGDTDEQARDRRLLLREPSSFRPSSLAIKEVEAWPEVVAKHLMYEVADGFRVAALAPGTVLAREEDLHRRHWSAWAEVLARTGAGREALQAAIERLWPVTADLLDMGDGIVEPEAWRSELAARLDRIGLAAPLSSPVPRRRGELDAETAGDLARIVSVFQSVYRTDPHAVWA